MKSITFTAILLLFRFWCFAQPGDTITIDYCYNKAITNYPLAKQSGLLDQSSALRISNLNKNYLPQLNLNGSASLQSDVTEVTIDVPAPIPPIQGPEISKDWYKLTLDVGQTIYDGSATRKQKQLEMASLKADQKSVESDLYKLKDRVNQLYFSIFLLQQNEAIMKETQASVESRLKEVNSAVANGMMVSSSADALKVEILRLEQQLTDNKIEQEASFRMLSQLISENIPETSKLVLPEVEIPDLTFQNQRPEYQLFDLQKEKIGTLRSMVIVKWNPKVSAYGQLGYGRPGLNMLDNSFMPWWIIGARFTWNLWNWNQNRNERQILDIQSQIVSSQQESFDKNLRITAEHDIADIKKYTELIRKDDEIIELRKRITLTTSSQMENGMVTSSEYISRLNDELMAKIARQLHQIQLVKAKQTYLYTLGKL